MGSRTQYILRLANSLKKKYDTTNPFELSNALGIKLYNKDLGRLKGMYLYVNRTRTMCINENLDDYMMNLVCFHEIGHDQLHRGMLAQGHCFKEFQLYNMTSQTEYEANIFASEFLLPTEDLLEYGKMGYDINQIAKLAYMDYNMVALKIATLVQEGYKFNTFDFRSDFLK